MKRKELMGILECFAFLLLTEVAWATPVPDTGQTKCYNNTVEIPCPSPGQPFYGQDGNYNINPMSYTKIDANGNVLADDATSWVMVRDNVTGLIWETKNSKNGTTDYSNPHDADNFYTWYDSNPATNGGDAGAPKDGTDTEDFINALNTAHFGGYYEWRLPTISELDSIVNCDIPNPGPTINTTYFPNTQSSFYWSSTTYAYSTNLAWGKYFFIGIDGYNHKYMATTPPPSYYNFYVRAVHGGQSQYAFVNNGNGTVTDTSTGLMWELKTNKDWVQNYNDPHDADNTYTWEQALSNCETSTLAGHSDWRLPTKKELRSLVDYSRYGPAINTTFFPETVSSFYWSSTGTDAPGFAWGVFFDSGSDSYGNKNDILSNGWVRAVRGGQSRLPGNLVIMSPNQADIWDIGSQKVITWNTQGIAGDVSITISYDGGRTYAPIILSTPNTGSYAWTVNGAGSVNCMIKIVPLSDPGKGTVQGLFSIISSYNPVLQAMITQNWISCNGFPPNTPAMLTIDQGAAGTVVVNSQTDENGDIFSKGKDRPGPNIAMGNVIDVVVGSVNATMTIQDLRATADAAANLINGSAKTPSGQLLSGRRVDVSISLEWGQPPIHSQSTTVDQNGNFQLNIEPFDLLTGNKVSLFLCDDPNGNNWGHRTGIAPFNDPKAIRASVTNNNYTDGSFKTLFDIYVWADPDIVIDDMYIDGPGGRLPYSKQDFQGWVPDPTYFWLSIDGPPATGTYTFHVVSNGIDVTTQDFQNVNRTMPIPDFITPENGAVLTSSTPTIEWSAVSYPGITVYYRLVIDDMNGNRIFSTPRQAGMLSATVPEDKLQAGQSYRLQIRTSDSYDWILTENVGRGNCEITIADSSKGDINGDGFIDLADGILALKILAGYPIAGISPNADVNGDGKIGMAEAIYVLQKVAGLQ